MALCHSHPQEDPSSHAANYSPMTRREALDTLTAATAATAAALLGPQRVHAADTPSAPVDKKPMPDPLFLDASLPIPSRGEDRSFHFGVAGNQASGCEVDGVSLRGSIAPTGLEAERGKTDSALRRWIPAMGEMHFSRVPPEMWPEALRAMHAGGMDIVSTYIFWIHHEEEKGIWNWDWRRHLRHFLETCKAVGIYVILRLGPWCHGEVRNGGLPDWLVADKSIHIRTDDPKYLEYAKVLYEQIAAQARGLLYKDGGPVIGVQIENEYGGPAEHLLSLKKIAIAVGFDVPLYTRTGWPHTHTPMPFGDLLPLSGAYAEGFWDRVLTPMPGAYPHAFHFELSPDDAAAAIGTDISGTQAESGAKPADHYPFLCCEMGGGMMSSYHRRIRIDPRDIESLALVKLGSGNNLPGFYMYHGGLNPDGKLTTLQESQATNYANDLPIKNYDFQAPIGTFGQIRPHYHGLRRIHLFLREFGNRLAPLPARLPAKPAPKTPDVRWAARTDGKTGLIFVNNYERLKPMPAIPGVRFSVKMADGETLTVPDEPITIPPDSSFFWPFRWEMRDRMGSITLRYATAQPITTDEDGWVWIFAQTSGVRSDFVFEGLKPKLWHIISTTAKEHFEHDGRMVFRDVKPGTGAAIQIQGERAVQIVLLDEAQSRQVWKVDIPRVVPHSVRWPVRSVFISPADLLTQGN